MTPEEIKAQLILRKISVSQLAKQIGVSLPSVSLAIHYKSTSVKVRKGIAEAIGKTPEEVFSLEAMTTLVPKTA